MARLDRHAAGKHQLPDPGPGSQLLEAPAHELVDIAMIVGQQHPGLHRAPIRARVVHQPPQRIIDARRVEQRQRPLGAGIDVECPVGDLVADHRERRRRKMARRSGTR